MKALILSCNTGGGHNACATAVQEAMALRGIVCDIRDALAFISKGISGIVSGAHVWLYRHLPGFYGRGYRYAENHPGTMGKKSVAYRLLKLGTGRLRRFIQKEGYTHVICTHLFPAMMLTHIAETRPLNVEVCFIATDYTASPGYEIIRADRVFIPHASLMDLFARSDLDDSRIIASGMPVRASFYHDVAPDEARRRLGLDPSHRHLLVMCGSMGCGPLDIILPQLSSLLPADIEVSVICGSNKRLRRKLKRSLRDDQRIHIHDYVDQVELFMDSADLYLTKAGGLSVSEAFAKRIPMALIDAVEGCETPNQDFCLRIGAARMASKPDEVARLCLDLLNDSQALADMRRAMTTPEARHPADIICDTIINDAERTVNP